MFKLIQSQLPKLRSSAAYTPTTVLHWPEPPQPDHHKEWPMKPGQKLNNISHLLYMDDIKLYVKSERDIDSLVYVTRI